MQYELETTDVSLDLFGSAKSKLIDKRITKSRKQEYLLKYNNIQYNEYKTLSFKNPNSLFYIIIFYVYFNKNLRLIFKVVII